MITAVGPTGIARAIELRSESVGKNEPVAKVDAAGPEASGAVTTPAAELAAQGAPVDNAKVAAIRWIWLPKPGVLAPASRLPHRKMARLEAASG